MSPFHVVRRRPVTPPSGTLNYSAVFNTNTLSNYFPSGCIHMGSTSGADYAGWGPSNITLVAQGASVFGVNPGSSFSQGPWIAPAPRIPGTYIAAMVVDGPITATGSFSGGSTQRAELTTSTQANGSTTNYYRPGNGFYLGFSVYYPSAPNGRNTQNNGPWLGSGAPQILTTGDDQSFPMPNPEYQTIRQQVGSQSLEFYGSSGPLIGGGSTPSFNVPVVLDRWTDFTVYVKCNTLIGNNTATPNADGIMTIWANGVQVFNMTNYYSVQWAYSDGTGPFLYNEYDWYRDAKGFPNLMYLGYIKEGNSYAIVQP